MKVLLTGTFGNVGKSTLDELLSRDYEVTGFEVPTRSNRKIAKEYGKNPSFNIIWGDIRNYDDVVKAVDGQDAVIHTAAIIPPLADRRPELAYAVNVGGTENIVKAMKSQGNPAKLIYTSSISIYGDRVKNPFIRVDDTLNPNTDDEYAKQKIMCEGIIRNSGLEWAILRLSYIVSPDKLDMDPLMFHMPLETSLEPCHTLDVGTALANAVGSEEIIGKTVNIAGGESCRTTYRAYLEVMIELFGLGILLLPDRAFSKSGFHCGFMDTEESQRLLNYQHHSLTDYFKEVKLKKSATRFFSTLGGELSRAIARSVLLKKSPYYSIGG
jgi:nucleoside-diphosphate-sugar epimerase